MLLPVVDSVLFSRKKFFFTGNCEYSMYNRKPEVIIPLEVLSGRWNIKMSFIIRRSSVGFLPLDMTKIEGCVDFTVGYFLHFFAGCKKWKRNTIISRENMREIFFYGSKLFVKMFSFFCFYVCSGWWWGFVSNIRSRSNFLKHVFHGVFSSKSFLFHSEEVIWMTTETFFPSGMFKSGTPSNLVGSYRSNTCQGISEVRANLEKYKKISLQYNSIFFLTSLVSTSIRNQ